MWDRARTQRAAQQGHDRQGKITLRTELGFPEERAFEISQYRTNTAGMDDAAITVCIVWKSKTENSKAQEECLPGRPGHVRSILGEDKQTPGVVEVSFVDRPLEQRWRSHVSAID